MVLDALRGSVGALAVGLFDDQRGAIAPGGEPVSFMDAFPDLDLPCLDVDWRSFYGELGARREANAACTCPRGHRLAGSLLHDRWIVLCVLEGEPSLAETGVETSTLKILATLLPARRAPVSVPVGDDAEGADGLRLGATGAPIWWVRKPRA